MTAPVRTCPKCGANYGQGVVFCTNDGTVLDHSAGAFTGKIIADRYRVLSQIGEGGMGQVFLAEHIHMKRKCAVKFLSPELAGNAGALKRFIREASNASRIDHPNVVTIYDFGETQDSSVYLAMEFIEGESLRKRIERDRAMPRDTVASIIRQTASALQAAHALGIVHRDLKPDNIMLLTRDGDVRVKVVDFGIAKAKGAEQKVTVTGAIVGTPDYMSPEQLTGDEVEGSADQYALALVAVKMLTGKLPFASTTSIESMTSRLTTQPTPLRQLRSDVAWPQQLQDVIGRALSGDAAQRFPSVLDFSRAFDKALGGMGGALSATVPDLPVPAADIVSPTRKNTEPPPAAPAPAKARRVLPLAVAAVLVMAVGGTTAVVLVNRAGTPASSASAPSAPKPEAQPTTPEPRRVEPSTTSASTTPSVDTSGPLPEQSTPEQTRFSKLGAASSAASPRGQDPSPPVVAQGVPEVSLTSMSTADLLTRSKNSLKELDFSGALRTVGIVLARDDITRQERIAALHVAAATLYPNDRAAQRPDSAVVMIRRLAGLGVTTAQRELSWPGLDSLFAAAAPRTTPDPVRTAPSAPETMSAAELSTELTAVRQVVSSDASNTQLSTAVSRINALLPRVAGRGDSIRLLSLRAQAQAFQDDQPAACRTLSAALGLAKGLSIESALTNTATRLNCP